MKHPQIVAIDFKGEVHTGTYSVVKGMLTVTSSLGSSPPMKLGTRPARRVAEMLLTDIVMEDRTRRRGGS